MKGCTDKDAIWDFFVANYLNCKWPKSQRCQTPPSVFPPKKHKICILKIKIWYHVKILVVLHHLLKEWKISDQIWACNICLLLWTSKMCISTAWPIVHWCRKPALNMHLDGWQGGRCLVGNSHNGCSEPAGIELHTRPTYQNPLPTNNTNKQPQFYKHRFYKFIDKHNWQWKEFSSKGEHLSLKQIIHPQLVNILPKSNHSYTINPLMTS